MRLSKNFFCITLPLTFVLVLAIEIILRKFFAVHDPFARFKSTTYHPFIPSQMPANIKYRLASNEGLPGMDTAMTFTTNNVGFRGDSLIMPKPEDEIRIFIIGGSTAQCLYIDDSKSLDRVLQNELQKLYRGKNIRVYGAAKSGDATSDHLAMLSQRIIHMQPDLVVLFSGINDLRKTVQRYDYLHLQSLKVYSPSYIYLAVTDFQIGRRLYYLFKRPTGDEIRQSVPLETNYHQLFAIQQNTAESDSIPYINTQPYEVNLHSIAGICRINGVNVLFMPNQSTWNSTDDTAMKSRHWLLTCGKVRYREAYLSRGLDSLNNRMRAVAQANEVPFFDLPSVLPKTSSYFYDDCHFNITGAAEAGKNLAAFITERKLLANSVSTIQYK